MDRLGLAVYPPNTGTLTFRNIGILTVSSDLRKSKLGEKVYLFKMYFSFKTFDVIC